MLTDSFKKVLTEMLGERVIFDVPMARHTSLRVGGAADALAMPADTPELIDLMGRLEQASMPWFVMGGGTNLMVRDGGIRGVVISLTRGFSGIEIRESGPEKVVVHAGAGAGLGALCRFAAESKLAGMDFAVGIPGTVGGAVIMNAGTRHGTMGSVVSGLEILNVPDKKETVSARDLGFTYRRLVWDRTVMAKSGHEPVVLAGFFELSRADERGRETGSEAMQAWRRQSQPPGFSAGCAFKNPSPDVPAGMLIDRAGLKGLQIGDARVSEIHANFILNHGRASAADILRLMEIIREKVLAAFGVELEPEIRIVGEPKDE